MLVYGLSLAFCDLASIFYHGVRFPTAGIVAFARPDGVGIFALIAGTYTPLAWCLMQAAGGKRPWRSSGPWRGRP